MSDHTFSIVFAGTSPFAVPSLDALAMDPAFHIERVITQPDRPVGRKQVLSSPAIKLAAERRGLPVSQPEKLNTEESIRSLTFDFLVVVSYGQILSQAILDLPKIAPVNLHASLLPRFRGASPIQHAILADDKETGITLQIMQKELDAGPILAQEHTPIDPRETAPTLHDRLARMGADLLVRTLKETLHPVPQDPSNITLCGKLSREDGMVDPKTMTAEEIDRKVRALHPWPGVTLTEKDETIKLIETDLSEHSDATPLACKDGTILYLHRVKPAGKNEMTGAAWERGRKN